LANTDLVRIEYFFSEAYFIQVISRLQGGNEKIKENISRQVTAPGWLKVLSRISAWSLFLNVLVLLLSGWGITQTGIIYRLSFGLVDRRLANQIHREAIVPLVIFFMAHIMINLNTGSFRRHLPNPLINILLGIVALGFITIAAYLQFFRPGG
jgi:cytochrome b subunit of formate dehydrogenase